MKYSRQTRYTDRQKKLGMVHVKCLVPSESKAELLSVAEKLRKSKRSNLVEYFIAPVVGVFFLSAPWVFAFYYY